MILFQIIRDKWDLTCSVYHNIETYGHVSLLFDVYWWFSSDVHNNKNMEINLCFLCFSCHLEYWKWRNERIN